MRSCLSCSLFLLLPLFPLDPSAARALCPADEIWVRASADTVSVQHWNAERNCCYELAVQFTNDSNTIDFFEGTSGEPCRCDCCFDLRYSACGFPAGTYTVRVWNEAGTELYGSAEVEIGGVADGPALVMAELGDCRTATAASLATWGFMKKLYR